LTVSFDKEQMLQERMKKLGIYENDIIENFIRSGGKGGQNVNKVATCVVLQHRPTGMIVKCQQERSQALNRFLARRLLVRKIEERILGIKSDEQKKREKIRRQKRRRSRRAKNKMLADKRHQADKKEGRKSVSRWEG